MKNAETNPLYALARSKTRFYASRFGFVWVRLPTKMGLFTGIEPIRCMFDTPGLGISSLTPPSPPRGRGILGLRLGVGIPGELFSDPVEGDALGVEHLGYSAGLISK